MKILHRIATTAALAALAALPLAACGKAAAPAAPKEKASIVDKEHKTVTLSLRASERLQIATVPITEADVTRTVKVGAEVVGSTKTASVLVRTHLNASDAAGVDPKQFALVRGLDDRDDSGVEAELDDSEDDAGAPDDDDKAVFFRVTGSASKLQVGQRATLEYAVQGGAVKRKILPYSALIYDVKGATWVFVATGKLTYQRQPVTLDFLKGDNAYLSEGPAAGALVVVTGPAELYGAETGVGK